MHSASQKAEIFLPAENPTRSLASQAILFLLLSNGFVRGPTKQSLTTKIAGSNNESDCLW